MKPAAADLGSTKMYRGTRDAKFKRVTKAGSVVLGICGNGPAIQRSGRHDCAPLNNSKPKLIEPSPSLPRRKGPSGGRVMSGERERNIRERAYAIWEQEGRPEGKGLDHWLQAEAEIGNEKNHWNYQRWENFKILSGQGRRPELNGYSNTAPSFPLSKVPPALMGEPQGSAVAVHHRHALFCRG